MPVRYRYPRPVRNTITLGPSLDLRAPIMQANLGPHDGPRLAAAVSRAGGLGTLTVHATDVTLLRRQLRAVRAITSRPISLAFTAPWQRDEVLETALEEGFRHFQTFWWNGPRLAPVILRGGGTVLWQVGTLAQAQEALEIGAHILVAQGTEAGGQVRSPRPILPFIQELRAELGEAVPIIAGGGLADRHDVQAVLDAGANAALLGTRFLLSEESSAAWKYKRRLLRATPQDLILDTRLIGDWPCAPRRYMRTKSELEQYALSAGLGIGKIYSLSSATDIVRDLTPRLSRKDNVS